MHARKIITAVALFLGGCNSVGTATDTRILSTPSIVILGIAQDGGAPQAGRFDDPRWDDSSKVRMIACLGIIDPRNGKRWMIDATPDFRRQLTDLARASNGPARPAVDGIFLTHAHIGHYTGLMYLGHESMGANGVCRCGVKVCAI